jgi:hypothetical protein
VSATAHDFTKRSLVIAKPSSPLSSGVERAVPRPEDVNFSIIPC